MLKEYIIKNEASRSQTEALVQSQAAFLRNLENQVGQLANELRNRPHGTLLSDTEKPKVVGNEHCKAMTLKSGKVLGNNATDAKHDVYIKHMSINYFLNFTIYYKQFL